MVEVPLAEVVEEAVLLFPAQQDWVFEPEAEHADLLLAEVADGAHPGDLSCPFAGETLTNVLVAAS
jgi:hypothetical protein